MNARLLRLRESLSKLNDRNGEISFTVYISDKSTSDKKVETFKVIIWLDRGQYKLQWTKFGDDKPELPELKTSVIKKLQVALKNSAPEYLTRGYMGRMINIESVLACINALEENGLVFDL